MAKKYTFQDFITKAKSIHGEKYEYDEKSYVDTHHKVRVFCKVEGHGWFVKTPKDFFKSKGCPKCVHLNHSRHKLLPESEVIDNLKIIGKELNILIQLPEGYTKSSIKNIKCTCLVDGYTWLTRYNDLHKRHGCTQCKYTNNKIKNKETGLHPGQVYNSIEIIETYTHTDNKKKTNRYAKGKCLKCGGKWEGLCSSLVNGNTKSCGCLINQAPGKAASIWKYHPEMLDKETYLYLVVIHNLIKVGIGTKNRVKRWRNLGSEARNVDHVILLLKGKFKDANTLEEVIKNRFGGGQLEDVDRHFFKTTYKQGCSEVFKYENRENIENYIYDMYGFYNLTVVSDIQKELYTKS